MYENIKRESCARTLLPTNAVQPDHANTVHKKIPLQVYKCVVCGIIVKQHSRFLEHLMTHINYLKNNPGAIVRCTLCKRRIHSAAKLIHHAELCEKFVCSKKKKKSNKETHLKNVQHSQNFKFEGNKGFPAGIMRSITRTLDAGMKCTVVLDRTISGNDTNFCNDTMNSSTGNWRGSQTHSSTTNTSNKAKDNCSNLDATSTFRSSRNSANSLDICRRADRGVSSVDNCNGCDISDCNSSCSNRDKSSVFTSSVSCDCKIDHSSAKIHLKSNTRNNRNCHADSTSANVDNSDYVVSNYNSSVIGNAESVSIRNTCSVIHDSDMHVKNNSDSRVISTSDPCCIANSECSKRKCYGFDIKGSSDLRLINSSEYDVTNSCNSDIIGNSENVMTNSTIDSLKNSNSCTSVVDCVNSRAISNANPDIMECSVRLTRISNAEISKYGIRILKDSDVNIIRNDLGITNNSEVRIHSGLSSNADSAERSSSNSKSNITVDNCTIATSNKSRQTNSSTKEKYCFDICNSNHVSSVNYARVCGDNGIESTAREKKSVDNNLNPSVNNVSRKDCDKFSRSKRMYSGDASSDSGDHSNDYSSSSCSNCSIDHNEDNVSNRCQTYPSTKSMASSNIVNSNASGKYRAKGTVSDSNRAFECGCCNTNCVLSGFSKSGDSARSKSNVGVGVVAGFCRNCDGHKAEPSSSSEGEEASPGNNITPFVNSNISYSGSHRLSEVSSDGKNPSNRISSSEVYLKESPHDTDCSNYCVSNLCSAFMKNEFDENTCAQDGECPQSDVKNILEVSTSDSSSTVNNSWYNLSSEMDFEDYIEVHRIDRPKSDIVASIRECDLPSDNMFCSSSEETSTTSDNSSSEEVIKTENDSDSDSDCGSGSDISKTQELFHVQTSVGGGCAEHNSNYAHELNVLHSVDKKFIRSNSIHSKSDDDNEDVSSENKAINEAALKKQYHMKECFVKLSRIFVQESRNSSNTYHKGKKENIGKVRKNLRICSPELVSDNPMSHNCLLAKVSIEERSKGNPPENSGRKQSRTTKRKSTFTQDTFGKQTKFPKINLQTATFSSVQTCKKYHFPSKKNHLDSYKAECSWCHKKFNDQNLYAAHLMTHGRKHVCSWCQREFFFHLHLLRHLLTCGSC